MNIDNVFPLSTAQESIYFDQIIKPTNPCYNLGCVVRLKKADFYLLQQGLNELVSQFDMFSARLFYQGKELVQSFGYYDSFPLEFHDYSNVDNAEEVVESLTKEQFDRVFTLGEDRLIESCLYRISEEQHVWCLRIHHILVDALGIALWVDNVKKLAQGQEIEAFSTIGSFRDVIVAEQAYLGSEKYNQDAQYWREKFQVLHEPMLLPNFSDQERIGTTLSHRVTIELDESLRNALMTRAKQLGGEINQLGLAALLIYFSKVAQRNDVVVSTPTHRRRSREQRNTVGMFTTDLPGCYELNASQTPAELIKAISKEQRKNMRHQAFPMHHLGRMLNLVAHGRDFLTEVVYNYVPLGVDIESMATNAERDPLHIRLTDYGANSSLTLDVYCRDEYVSKDEAYQIGKRYIHVLEQLAKQEEPHSLQDIEVITQAERDTLLTDFNDTSREELLEHSWPELFAKQVVNTPDAIAVQQDGHCLSYRELDNASNRVANALRMKNIGSGNLVGVLEHRGPDFLTMLVGIIKSGAAWIPFDPNHPSQRWLDVLGESEPEMLLVGDSMMLEHRVMKRKWRKEKVKTLAELMLECENESPIEVYPSLQDLAYVIFTSGSTGKPKGVMIEHAGLINNMLAKFKPLSLTHDDVIAQTASQCFDISIWQNLTALLLGARVNIVPNDICRDPNALLEYLNKYEVTIWEPVPSMIDAALAYKLPLTSLRWVLPTGEALTAQLVERWFQRYAEIPLMNAYGPAECADDVAFQPIHSPVERVLIGKPVANVRLHIVDNHLALLPIGAVGEIAVSGPIVGRGYLNLPEQTDATFVANPFAQDDLDTRLYLTGDLARRLSDGSLEYIGRKDHQLKIRGYRIEPGEIESVLQSHESVRKVVVDAKPDKFQQLCLVAYIVTNSAVDLHKVREFLKGKLPNYMIPQAIVEIAQLPLTANGKVDRSALPEPMFEEKGEFIEPKTQTEEKLAHIWMELLNRERVSTHANFFELGGHSLLASRLVSVIREAWQVELSIKTVFETDSLADLAITIEQASQSELPRIGKAPHGESLPLSFAQQRLWFIDQVEESATEYNMAAAFHIDGVLNTAVLSDALKHIIMRHHVLHTVYREIDNVIEQVRLSDVDFVLEQQDLSPLDTEEQEKDYTAQLRAQILKPFDLSCDLMLRAKLLKLADTRYYLILTVHHIASDGWSKKVLIDELSALYTAFIKDQNDPLTQLEIQYSDYAHWQRAWLVSERLQSELSFWKKELQGLPPVHTIPLDKPRPAVQSHNGEMLSATLSASTSLAVQQFAKNNNVTLFMLLNAALASLLSRYSNEEDIVVGTPTANRDQTQVAPLVGFFVNTVLMRSDLSGDPSFSELLSRSKECALNAFSHSQLPFDAIVEALQPTRSLSYNPLFQVMLALQNNEQSEINLPEACLTEMPIENVRSQFDLSLEAQQNGDYLQFNWTWATDLFEKRSIEAMSVQFNRLLESVISEPNLKISDIPLINECERQTLLDKWNGSVQSSVSTHCIHERFESQANERPDAIALTIESEAISYDQLNKRANRLAHYLISQGVGADMLVGLCVERSAEMIVGILAILKAGGAYLPLDPAYPENRLTHMLEDSGVNIILCQSHLESKLPLEQQLILHIDDQQRLLTYPDTNPQNSTTLNNLAYVIYTSGSTGKPKGVMVEHQQISRLFETNAADFRFNHTDVWTLFHSYAFDFSVWEIWGALSFGGRLVIVPHWVARSTPEFYDLLDTEKVTVLNQTPTAFGHLINVDLEQCKALSLRCVIFGGEALNLNALVPWIERHGDAKPELVNMYGITETTVHVTYRRIYRSDITLRGNASLIGAPLNDLSIYLLTPSLDLVPVGVPGEMYVGGKGVTRGYLNRKTLTNERFIVNPFNACERLYRTGDLARYRTDGELEYLGRCDQQVKIRGFRIELGEVESCLLGLPEVIEAVVVARNEPLQLAAYFVMSKDVSYDESSSIIFVRDALSAQLPEHMVPSAFVKLEKLPITANGKVDKKALPEPFFMGHDENNYVAPKSEIERVLCDVWQAGLQIESVGITDNFFHIGGDSIRAISIVSASKKAGLNYSIRDLFAYPNIHSLASAIEEKRTQVIESQSVSAFSLLNATEKNWLDSHPQRARLVDAYPQSTLQQGMIVHNLLDTETGMYRDVFGFHLKARWNLTYFEQAVAALVAEHESFRTVFCNTTERPLLLVFEELAIPFEYRDLRELNHQQQKEDIASWTEQDNITGFDFDSTLWRIVVHHLKDDEFYYQIIFHHSLWDGWSVANINTTLFNYYSTLCNGGSLPEPSSVLSYSHFIAAEQNAVESAGSEQYWKEKLQDAQLPWWATAEQEGQRLLTYKFSSTHNEKIKALAHQLNVQEKSVLLAVHTTLLALISGNSDVTTSVVANGRPEVEGSERALGLFLNSLPLRVKDFKLSWCELIRQLNGELLDLMEHRTYPLSAIQDAVGMEFSASLFNYIDFHVYKNMGDEIQVVAVDDFEMTNYLFDANYSRDPLTNSLEASISLDSGCFDEGFSERIHNYIDNIVSTLVERPESQVNMLEYLGEQEVAHSLVDWNNTSDPSLMSVSWPELFARQVAKTPDAIVATCKGQHLTFAELNDASEIIAKNLCHHGVQVGDIVGVLDHRGLDYLVMMVAVLKSGAAYLPLDPEQPSNRWLQIIGDSNPALILVGDKLSLESRWLNRNWKSENVYSYSQLTTLQYVDQITLSFPSLNDLAYILFTSGSTGTPKGVMVEHRGMVNNMLSKIAPLSLTKASVIAQTASQCFDISVWQFLTAPIIGAKLSIVPNEITQDPQALLDHLRISQITHWEPVPSVMKAALHYNVELPSLKWVLPTGEALTPVLVKQWFAQYPEIPLMNAYGPAECSDDVAFQPISGPVDRVLIGKPIANARLHVVTPDLALAPIGVVGELAVSGPVVGRGYIGLHDKTKEVFIDNPWPQDAFDSKMYLTGDLVKRDIDGSLEYLGRKDFQVKVRGYRIETGEIESVLTRHELVKDAVVVSALRDEDDYQLVAYVVTDTQEAQAVIGVTELKDYLRQHLPHYMVPAIIMQLDSFPLSTNGKLDRNALPDPDINNQSEYEAPTTDIEKGLAAVWEQLLKGRKVGRNDNFFDIGGHSLLATRMINEIRELWAVELPLKAVFEASSISDIAILIENAKELETLSDDVDLDNLSEEELDRYLEMLSEQGVEV
ncbi:non-ribosomal peptide synthetase [Pseudoalteromonas ostreae]|uniref:non-ribosomal peptide synthetase n=1 Tax=Pseudoalteromonas ostreae TaxID=2774154 RepID=UPI001B374DC5|nr:non-ribosomal peptide synthetase [Pseudoalteromonas ostreae]